MPSKKIKNSVKLAIVLFVLSNMSTAALAVMWSECGFRSILCLLGGGNTLNECCLPDYVVSALH